MNEYDSIFKMEKLDKICKINKKIEDYIYYNLEKFYLDIVPNNGLCEREGQENLSYSILNSMSKGKTLIMEAGVGIGKSYAYLVPMIYYSLSSNEPIIISTSTISLQEQLENDIEKLSKLLNVNVNVSVIKGMNNYLCLDKLIKNISNKKFEQINEKLQDRSNYPNISDYDWNKIAIDKCYFEKCKLREDCKFYNIRREVKNNNTNIIICNHNLLIEDLNRSYNKLLYNSKFIVIDEAHNFESKVRDYNTKKLDLFSISRTITHSRMFLVDYKEAMSILADVLNLSEKIKKIVNNKIEELEKQNIYVNDIDGMPIDFDEETDKLVNIIIDKLNNIIISLSSRNNILIESLMDEIVEHIYTLESLAAKVKSEYVYWATKKDEKIDIFYAPKKIDKICCNLLTKKEYKNFILTSATLCSLENDYSYLISNLGLYGLENKYNNRIIVDDSQKSPYDYDNNTMLYLNSNIENPCNKLKYLNDLVISICDLIDATKGRTLVLFTSKNDMNYVYNKIGNNFNGYNIYVQNDGSSQNVVKEKFRDDTNSVLLSTGTFWEGIDIKGESLSSVIIARLPFPVPNPVLDDKASRFEDGFKKVYLQEMLIKLKQGVGRLIRSENDKGVVSILDSRAKKYLEEIKKVLPIKNITSDYDDFVSFINENLNNEEQKVLKLK